MKFVAETKDTFLGSALFFIAAGAAKGRIKAVFVKRLFQRVGLHHLRVLFAVFPRIDAELQPSSLICTSRSSPSSFLA